jgi:HSP20 family protein
MACNLSLRHPAYTAQTLQEEFNRLLSRSLDADRDLSSAGTMHIDIKETDDAFLLKADLPGMRKEDIRIHVEDDLLTLSGERKFEDEESRENYHRIERSYGRFSRVFQLAGVADASKIAAQYADGVLTVTLPKREEAKPRQIEVAVH